MPRPDKCTPECQKALLDAFALGAPIHLACDYAGISDGTYYMWQNLAADGDERYVALFDAIQKQRGRAALGWLAKIEAAASDGNWQAAAWKLERRYPKDFGRVLHEVTGADGGPLQITMVRYGDDDHLAP